MTDPDPDVYEAFRSPIIDTIHKFTPDNTTHHIADILALKGIKPPTDEDQLIIRDTVAAIQPGDLFTVNGYGVILRATAKETDNPESDRLKLTIDFIVAGIAEGDPDTALISSETRGEDVEGTLDMWWDEDTYPYVAMPYHTESVTRVGVLIGSQSDINIDALVRELEGRGAGGGRE